jgi:GNAT superfamily N-acetyltransferase
MGEAMKFDEEYQDRIRVPGGELVKLRLVQPSDKARLHSGFRNLSAASRQKRFFGAKDSLSDAELGYFTDMDHCDHFAIGAVEVNSAGEEGDGVGVGRFIRLPQDVECAEVAITVIDRMQGKGIGRTLLERLIDAAVERNINRFRFECLPNNLEIRKLVQKVCKVVDFVNDVDVITAQVELPGRHLGIPERPIDTCERLFVLLRSFAAGALELKGNFGIGTVKHSVHRALDKRSFRKGKNKAPQHPSL